MDTGSGHDLVSKREIRALGQALRRADNPMRFCTANGSTNADYVCRDRIKLIDEIVSPYALEQTPCSVVRGGTLHEDGLHVHMALYERPLLITPRGDILLLAVDGDIPYLDLDHPECKRMLPGVKRMFAAAPAEVQKTLSEIWYPDRKAVWYRTRYGGIPAKRRGY